MNSRIAALLEVIANNASDITDIYRSGTEYYFAFRGRYFSLLKRSKPVPALGDYIFYVYPRAHAEYSSLKSLADDLDERDISEYPMAYYNEVDFVPGQRQRLQQIYTMLSERTLGLDELLDDIGV